MQAIAAGQQDQLVSDRWGPGQHSIFTGLFLERLRQRGGLLTGNEMGLYLQRQVGLHTRSRQTPHYGQLLGSEGGDFVFWAEESTVKLPAELVAAIENPLPGVREGAVRELAYLAKGSHPELATLARNSLNQLMRDDSRRVSGAARAVLEELFPGEVETYPGRISSTDSLPLLVFTEGPLKGQRIPVMTSATIGRMLGSTIVIDDPRISGFHAEIEQRGDGQLWITDLNSTNGTFVNDQKLEESLHLNIGDEVAMGDSRFRLEQASPAEVFEGVRHDVTLESSVALPTATVEPSIPAVSVDQPAPSGKPGFMLIVRHWWGILAGLLSALGFTVALLSGSGTLSLDSRFSALAMIPGTILFGVVAVRQLLQRRWLSGALQAITTVGLLIMGIWIWDAYGTDSVDAWGIALVVPVIPATIWLAIDAIRAGKERD